MPTANKTKKAPAKRAATTSRGASVGGIKTKSKKKFILFSLVALLVLAGIGYGGNYAWQKYQTRQQLSKAKSALNANAASVGYIYGRHFQIRDNTRHRRLLIDGYACKYGTRYIRILSARRGLITQATYQAQGPISNSDWVFGSGVFAKTWWNNMNIVYAPTVDRSISGRNRNMMNYHSGRLKGDAQAVGTNYGSRVNDVSLPTRSLPVCH